MIVSEHWVRVCARVGVLVIASVVAACRGGDSRQSSADSARAPAGAVRRSRATALGWRENPERLVLLRVDQFAAGDAGRVACDSTGIFERTADGHLSAAVVTPAACQMLWHVDGAALSPDGQSLLVTTGFEPNRSTILKLSDLSKRPLPTKCPASAFAWSPTGDRVAVVEACDSTAAGATLEVRSLTDSGAARVLLTGVVGTTTWSPDGRRLAVARKGPSGAPEIVVLDAAGGALRTLARGRDPAWSPSGDWIAYLAADSGGKPSREIRVVNKDGGKERRIAVIGEVGEQHRYVDGLVWSRNSEKIAAALAEQLWIVNAVDSAAAPVRVQ